jgi:hypothetical protein
MRTMREGCLASLFALVALLCSSFTGCQSMKAKPSAGAGFVPLQEMTYREDLPFHKVWVKSGVDWKKYQSLYVEDVNTHYLLASNWWQQSMRQQDMEADVREVARYMKHQFEGAFRNDPRARFQVVQSPAAGCLVVEMALTELVPSNPVLEALSIAAPYGSGVAVQAVAKESGAKATAAFEAKIKDAGTGEVLAMVADREQGKVAPVNLRALTWYKEAEGIIDEWAAEFVQIANRRPGETVKDASPFTLRPW